MGSFGLLASFSCLLRPQRFLHAIEHRMLFDVGEFGVGVHRQIEPWRHVALSDLGSHIGGVPLRVVPLSEVQMAASAIDISLDKP